MLHRTIRILQNVRPLKKTVYTFSKYVVFSSRIDKTSSFTSSIICLHLKIPASYSTQASSPISIEQVLILSPGRPARSGNRESVENNTLVHIRTAMMTNIARKIINANPSERARGARLFLRKSGEQPYLKRKVIRKSLYESLSR